MGDFTGVEGKGGADAEVDGGGEEVFVFGKLTGAKPRTMDHPETEVIEAGEDSSIHINRIVPVYPLLTMLVGPTATEPPPFTFISTTTPSKPSTSA